jgi:hypothetical protein
MKKHKYEYVKNYIEVESNSGFTLVEPEYKNNNTNMRMICNNGHSIKKTFVSFLVGKRCWECHIENNRGSNSNSWKPDISEEDRLSGRLIEGYNDWTYSVYERDKYTCQCCGKKCIDGINAHHMDGYNWCKERRIDVSNGVTLCDKCHTLFHRLYGYGNNTIVQFTAFIIEYGVGIFNINNIILNSILLIKPEKRTLYEKQEYFKEYYKKYGRKHSEEELDIVFNEVIEKYNDACYLTSKGFDKVSPVNVMTFTKLFKINWLEILERYGKLNDLFNYILKEYMAKYLATFDNSLSNFCKNHKYITQQIIKLFGIEKIKNSCGFIGVDQEHNFDGLKRNFDNIVSHLNRIPFYNEFIKYTKIGVTSYYKFFGVSTSYEKVLPFLLNDIQLKEYKLSINRRNSDIMKINSKKRKFGTYTDEEKEIEFRRVFDNFYQENNRYPTRREFNKLSIYTDGAYRKKYKLSWNQTKVKYGYL